MSNRSNHVADTAEVAKLRPLPLLHGLVLADCPISEIDDYRMEVTYTVYNMIAHWYHWYYYNILALVALVYV